VSSLSLHDALPISGVQLLGGGADGLGVLPIPGGALGAAGGHADDARAGGVPGECGGERVLRWRGAQGACSSVGWGPPIRVRGRGWAGVRTGRLLWVGPPAAAARGSRRQAARWVRRG